MYWQSMYWIVFAVLVALVLLAAVARARIHRGRLLAAVLVAFAAVVAFEVLVRTDTISARTAGGWMMVVAIGIAVFFTTVLPRLDRPH
jgi:hypothetical protein